MLKRLIPLGVAAAAAAAPAQAGAITLQIGQPDLEARVSVAVPVTVTCSPFDPTFTLFSDYVSVSISQAVDKQIAHGTGTLGRQPVPGGTGTVYACDGNPHTITVIVPAATDGPPFKREHDAVLDASTGALASDSCTPFGCFGQIEQQTGDSGPIVFKLK